MGGIADHRALLHLFIKIVLNLTPLSAPHRKKLLLGFAVLGALSATSFLLLPSSSPVWILSALSGIFANVGFGASVVAMNAYLPTLAKDSPSVTQILAEIDANNSLRPPEGSQDDQEPEESSPLIHDSATPLSEEALALKKRYDTELSNATSRISALGIALGYGAGIILLVVALIPVTKLHGSTFSLRLAIGLSGIWWALFSIPAALWLPDATTAQETNIEWTDEGSMIHKTWNTRREIVAAWRRLGGMLRWREVRKLGNTFKYLAAWFLLSDGLCTLLIELSKPTLIDLLVRIYVGFTTMSSTAILFGKTTLNMKPPALILIGILAPTSGIVGSLIWPILQRRFAWTNLKVLIILVVMISAIPAYGCLGFLSVFHGTGKVKFGGLTTQGELFGMAVYFGEWILFDLLACCLDRHSLGL